MKKIITTLSLVIMTAMMAFAQRTVVTGTIIDSSTGEGEPSAILQFFKAADLEKPIAFTTTDPEGKFSQVLTERGDYQLLFDNMGRKTVRRDFTVSGQPSIDLGTIYIEDDAQVLQAGTVVAQRPLVKMEVDRMTYDVENDVDSKTSTVLDMLRKVPMVSVDGQDNITVNGSSSFQVYVDGKPNQMISSNPSVVFKMMPASAVKDIQVVTNPGVRYDAEGVGGVLNITTSSQGSGQSVSDGSYGSVRLMGNTNGAGLGLYLSAQRGKWAGSLNLNGMTENLDGTSTSVDREQYSEFGTSTLQTSTGTDMKMKMLMGNASVSYEIDDQNLVSATAGLMGMGITTEGTMSSSMSGGIYGEGFSYDGTTSNESSNNSITASVDYQHKWADVPERIYTLSYQYSGSPSVNNNINTFGNSAMAAFTDRKTDGRNKANDHTVQADFTTPLGSKGSISTGTKFLFRHNSSDDDFYLWTGYGWQYNDAGSMDYNFYNRIAAAYSEYSGNYGKVGVKGGLRYEYTWQNVTYAEGQGNDFSTQYGNLVPSASLQYNISQTSNIGVSYNMRISRPGISYLNPFVDTSDPTAKSYGNSDLKTETAHNISLVYNYYSPKWIMNLTGRYIYTPNGISQYSFYDRDNIINSTYGNIVKSSSTGLNAFLTWIPGPKTRVIFNGGASYEDITSPTLGQSNSGISYNGLLGFQQTLPLDLRFSGNAVLMGNSYSLQGWNSGISLGMASLTKAFLDDRLSFSLSAVSHIGKGKGMQVKGYTEGTDFKMNTLTNIPMRQVMLSVSFSFGKQRNVQVKTANRTIQNDDVLNSQSTAESLGSGLMGM